MKKSRAIVMSCAISAAVFSGSAAHALENEFHGGYTLAYFMGNYESAGAPGMILTGPDATLNAGPAGLPFGNTKSDLKTNNYFEQRVRLYYTAKASEIAKLVTAFEIDTVWGDKAGGSATRNSGAALEGDAVNLETKWAYLDLAVPSTPVKAKLGLHSFKDNLKGIFVDFDAAGINTVTDLGKAKVNLAYFRAYDRSFLSSTPKIRGRNNLDIAVAAVKYDLGKNASLGANYYLYNDTVGLNVGAANTDMKIHTFGLNGDANMGKVNLSGFLAYQSGVFKGATLGKSNLDAVAYNVAVKAPLGAGTLKSALLFTSGNDNDASNGKSKHYTGWVGTNTSQNSTWNVGTGGTNSYAESGMMLLNRATVNMPSTTDNHLVFNSGNGTLPTNSQGQYLVSLGYDLPVTPKLLVKTNAGAVWAARTNALRPTDKTTGKQNDSHFQGAEINVETGYKLSDNVTAKFQAAYVMLGGYYDNSWSSAVTGSGIEDPENPYTGRLIVQYVF